MASYVDEIAMAAVMTGMAAAAAAAQESRTRSFDQLSEGAAAMWQVALTSPTVNAGFGYRTAAESGSNRTRAETNNPGNTAAPGGTP